MAGKKECRKEGCGTKSVKDDLCTKHYKAEHGEAPFPSGRKLDEKRSAKRKARPGQAVSSSGKKGRVKRERAPELVSGECEGCKKLNATMAIMVTMGLISEETVKDTKAFVETLIG